jgi:hypothetical protein
MGLTCGGWRLVLSCGRYQWTRPTTTCFLCWWNNGDWRLVVVVPYEAGEGGHSRQAMPGRVCAGMACQLVVLSLGRRGWEEGATVGGGVDRRTSWTHHGCISIRRWGMHAGEAGTGAWTHLTRLWVRGNGSMQIAAVQTRWAWQALDKGCSPWRVQWRRTERQVTWKWWLTQWQSFHSKHSRALIVNSEEEKRIRFSQLWTLHANAFLAAAACS